MLCNTRGIVLSTVKYSETSLICKIYTEKLGIQSYIINGVRKQKSVHKAALLQSLSLLDMVVYYKPGRDLHRIKEIRVDYLFTEIPFDIRKSTIALFMAEVLQKCVREEEENEVLFQYLHSTIIDLDEREKGLAYVPLLLLLRLSLYLGFFPNMNSSVSCPYFDLREGCFVAELPNYNEFLDETDSRQLNALLNHVLDDTQVLSMGSESRKDLLQGLLQYYQLHMPHFRKLNSVEVLAEVLNA